MKWVEFETTWGPILLTLDGEKAVGLQLPPLAVRPQTPFGFLPATSEPRFHTLEDLIAAFPNGNLPAGTPFQKKVWRALKTIPRGATRTYGEIAAAIGQPGAARAVGAACGANPLPLFIPCHRIVAKNGLGGFGSGLPWKVLLLKMEGAL
jgi:O-6-methylguanine DNA methyltransferase